MNQRDIAKIAGVSSATISRVINDSPGVSAKTSERVKKAIREHGYVQNAWARNLRMSNTKTIGYLVPDIKNPFFTSLLAGFQEMLFKKGYDIIFENSDDDIEKEKVAINTLMRYRVNGLLAVFVDADRAMERFGNIDIPIVMIDRKPGTKQVHDYLLVDNVDGISQIVEYLASLGHKDIAFLEGQKDVTPGIERYRGYEAAMRKMGLAIVKEFLVYGGFNEACAYGATKTLLTRKRRPTAIIAPNNVSCMGAYKALVDSGVSLPREMALAGFDDFPLAAYLNPPVTVVNRPTTEMGRMAAELLLERINKGADERKIPPRTIILPTELNVRGSCIPVREMSI